MTFSVIPDVIDAFIEKCSAALDSCDVCDGYDVTRNDFGTYLYVGIDDPLSTTAADSASSTREIRTANTYTEIGSITCALTSWNGECDQKAARDAVYDLMDDIQGVLDVGLGIVNVCPVLADGHRFRQDQTAEGAFAGIVFDLSFKARIS